MIYSMTGYGKCSKEINHKKVTIEVRTLNSKGFDLNLKITPLFREKENELRNFISQKLDRGKIDFWITVEDLGNAANVKIDTQLVKSYYHQLKELGSELGTDTDWLQVIFKIPDVIKTTEGELSDEEWKEMSAMVEESLDQCMKFRRTEGEELEIAIKEHVVRIETLLQDVIPYEQERITKLKDKLLKNLEENIVDGKVDKDRFEQEIIFYLEKLDLTEEKIRLASHCKHFVETMAGEGYNGRKLNFIGQEMGREINTLGSKANHAEIQKIVVLMKDELEKIKEQVLNVL